MFSSATLLSFLAAAPMGAFAASKGAAFSYDPNVETGPAFWKDLPIEGNVCNGKKNSPIAVESMSCTQFEDYKFTDGECRFKDMIFELTSTGVKASFPETCVKPTVQIPGISGEYEALQFHIHTSSEHTIDGEFFGAELHTVHAEIGGDRYAVVGMMIQPDAAEENPIFKDLLKGWQGVMEYNVEQCQYVGLARGGDDRKLAETTSSNAILSDELFSTYMLIPDGAAYYHYDGGLTTPPCSEVVWWNLADKPVSVSPGQYEQLVDQIVNYITTVTCKEGTYAGPVGSTSRPTVALNGRTVDRICPVGFDEDSSASSASISAVAAAAFAGAALLF